MATYTTNLNLEKPATSENFDLLKINANWDKIDAGYGQTIKYETSVTNLAIHKQLNTVYLSFYSFSMGSDGKTLTQVVPSGYRPFVKSIYMGKTYNGSAYVDCLISIDTDGKITITDMFNNGISNIQPNYTKPGQFIYELGSD